MPPNKLKGATKHPWNSTKKYATGYEHNNSESKSNYLLLVLQYESHSKWSGAESFHNIAKLQSSAQILWLVGNVTLQGCWTQTSKDWEDFSRAA